MHGCQTGYKIYKKRSRGKHDMCFRYNRFFTFLSLETNAVVDCSSTMAKTAYLRRLEYAVIRHVKSLNPGECFLQVFLHLQ